MQLIQKIEQAFCDDMVMKTAYPASVLIVITNEVEPRMLFCRRAMRLNSHAGEVSLPGGKREDADTNNASVALRETHEEAGIHPSQVSLVGELPPEKARSGMVVKPIVGIVSPNLELVAEESEVARLFWVKVVDLTPENIVPHRITFKGVKLNTPSFQLEDEIIWGLTGRIVISFMNHVFQRDTAWPMVITAKR